MCDASIIIIVSSLTDRSGHRCIDADLRLAQVAAVRCPGDVVLAFVLLVRQAHAAVRLLTSGDPTAQADDGYN